MTIEEEIKQKKFASEHQKALINILFTSSWLHHRNALQLKDYDITPEQFNVLRILRGSYPQPLMLAEISCRMIDRSSNATRLVEKLRLKGLVDRQVCEKNRRQVDIVITEKGLSVLTRIDNDPDGLSEVLNNLTVAEAKELNRLLDKLRK